MFEVITTLFRGAAAKGREQLIDANAVLLLEQKIRDISSRHDNAKRTLAAMIAQHKSMKRAEKGLKSTTADLEDRAHKAMDAGRQELAMQAAQVIADNENELALKQKSAERIEIESAKLRALVERTERRLIELRQGLMVARQTENARTARVGTLKSLNNGHQSIRDAEHMLERILGQTETEEALDEYTTLNQELSGQGIAERLDEAGFGDPLKVRPNDVLERLKGKTGRKNKARS
jgi:phage shock protein A